MKGLYKNYVMRQREGASQESIFGIFCITKEEGAQKIMIEENKTLEGVSG